MSRYFVRPLVRASVSEAVGKDRRELRAIARDDGGDALVVGSAEFGDGIVGGVERAERE